MTGYRDIFDDSLKGEEKGEYHSTEGQREWARRRTKLKQRPLTDGPAEGHQSFTEIGAGFGDLDAVGDDISPTSRWLRRKSRFGSE